MVILLFVSMTSSMFTNWNYFTINSALKLKIFHNCQICYLCWFAMIIFRKIHKGSITNLTVSARYWSSNTWQVSRDILAAKGQIATTCTMKRDGASSLTLISRRDTLLLSFSLCRWAKLVSGYWASNWRLLTFLRQSVSLCYLTDSYQYVWWYEIHKMKIRKISHINVSRIVSLIYV